MLSSKYHQIGLGHQILSFLTKKSILLFILFILYIGLGIIYCDAKFLFIGNFIIIYIVILYILYHIFFIIIVPLLLKPKIYYNPDYKDINFSQKELLSYFPAPIFYLISCTAYKDKNSLKNEKKLITYFVYYDLINTSFKDPNSFKFFFIGISIYIIFGFTATLTWILFYIDYLKKLFPDDYLIFIISTIPIIIYAYYTLCIFSNKEYFYINYFNKAVKFGKYSKRNLNIFSHYFLVDKTIEQISEYHNVKNDAFKLLVEVVIAIYFAVSIPLIYNAIYPIDVKIVGTGLK